MEVVQLAHILANALGLNVDLAEAIAYGHDLGHPPFGHSGERALRKCLENDCPFTHASQSVRILDKLATLPWRPPWTGLNLTKQTLDGIKTHSYGSSPEASTLEGQIVRYADFFAYIHSDFEDIGGTIVIFEEKLIGLREALTAIERDPRTRLKVLLKDLIDNSTPDRIQLSSGMQQLCDEIDRAYADCFQEAPFSYRDRESEHVVTALFNLVAKQLDEAQLKRLFVDQGLLGQSNYDRLKSGEVSREEMTRDYLAGMTDNYAIDLFDRFLAPKVVSRW